MSHRRRPCAGSGRALSVVLALALGTLLLAPVAAPRAARAATAPGCTGARFHPLAPTRVYDSDDPGDARVGQTPVAVDVSALVPSGACAVVATLTGSAATADTYVTAYPDGSPRPLASNLNLLPGEDAADLVTVALDSTRVVDLYVHAGTARLILDVAGWYSATDAAATDVYVPMSPIRVLDTGYGIGTTATSVGPGEALTLTPATMHVPANADAVSVNLTEVGGAAPTFVSAYPADTARPTTSVLNVSPGDTRAALATVRISPQGLTIYNNAGTVRLVADIEGWYSPTATGALFSTSDQPRITTVLGPQQTADITVDGGGSVPAAALFTLTAAGATTSTVERAYPTPSSGSAVPNVSNVNVDQGRDTPNLVAVAVAPSGDVRLHNLQGTVTDLVDLAGYFSARPAGYDVSEYQCDSGSSTATTLPTAAAFGIINPTAGGLAFSGPNPCLAAEEAWARTAGDEEFYLPLADKGAASQHYTTPFPDAPQLCASGQATAAYDADPGCAYDYGWDQAEDAVTNDVDPTGSAAVPWWLDIEPGGTGTNFVNETGQSQSASQNALVIEGAIAYLTQSGATSVGLYSNAASWSALVGSQPGFSSLPEWYAQAGLTPAQLVASCTTPFAGGTVSLVQDGSTDAAVLDTDLRC